MQGFEIALSKLMYMSKYQEKLNRDKSSIIFEEHSKDDYRETLRWFLA